MDIKDYTFTDTDVAGAEGVSTGPNPWAELHMEGYEYSDLTIEYPSCILIKKEDAIALAKHFKLSEKDLK